MTFIKQSAFTGLSTARPPPTASGRVYYCTDMPVQYVDDPSGNGWLMFVDGTYCPKPASASSYTTVGSIALNNYADVLRTAIYTNSTSAANCALLSGTLTSTVPWIINLVSTYNSIVNTEFPEMGVIVTNGTTSGVSTGYGLYVVTNVGPNTFVTINSQFTVGGTRTISPQLISNQGLLAGNGLIHIRLLNDTINLHYQMSSDGFHWSDVFCQTTPSGLTNYGHYVGCDVGTGSDAYGQILVYRNDLIAPSQFAITGATTASPIVITAVNHNFQSGDTVSIQNVGGLSGANSGTTTTGIGSSSSYAWMIQVLSSSTFSLIGSSGSSTYTSGGTATLVGR